MLCGYASGRIPADATKRAARQLYRTDLIVTERIFWTFSENKSGDDYERKE